MGNPRTAPTPPARNRAQREITVIREADCFPVTLA